MCIRNSKTSNLYYIMFQINKHYGVIKMVASHGGKYSSTTLHDISVCGMSDVTVNGSYPVMFTDNYVLQLGQKFSHELRNCFLFKLFLS